MTAPSLKAALAAAAEQWAARPEAVQPVRIEAAFAAPIGGPASSPLSLEGVLQWLVLDAAASAAGYPGPFEACAAEPVDAAAEVPLPLARAVEADVAVWMVSDAEPVGAPARGAVRWVRKRADIEAVSRGATKVVINTGATKSLNMAIPATLWVGARWHALADPDRLRALLRRAGALGSQRAGGLGHVVGWRVLPGDRPDAWRLRPDGTPARRLPVAIRDDARALGAEAAVVRASAPMWLPTGRVLCALPRQGV